MMGKVLLLIVLLVMEVICSPKILKSSSTTDEGTEKSSRDGRFLSRVFLRNPPKIKPDHRQPAFGFPPFFNWIGNFFNNFIFYFDNLYNTPNFIPIPIIPTVPPEPAPVTRLVFVAAPAAQRLNEAEQCNLATGKICALDNKCYVNTKAGTKTFSAAQALCKMASQRATVVTIPAGATFANFYDPCLGKSHTAEMTAEAWVSQTTNGQCQTFMIDFLGSLVEDPINVDCENQNPNRMYTVYCNVITT